MEDIKVKFSDAINPGLIIGLISIVLSLAFQFIFPDLQTQQKIGYFSWAAILGLAVYYGIQYRKKRGDAGLPFGKAFAFLFYAMLISSVLSIVFMYLNYSIINPDMVEQVKEM
ncbi:MAG: DUF4199 domain-containing protein, partial [Bacteroidales bacterium]|nr:DUF4199 domain-containing protein [Bacteroidales bacterium]